MNGVNYTTSITTTTTYINGFVYESLAYGNTSLSSLQYTDVLQFLGHEEGRIRRKTDGTFTWDYFLKDHLGNVRMVLTEESKTDMYPAATMESATTATEQLYYANLPATRVDVPTALGYPANTPSGNLKVAKVTGTAGGTNIGPAITLKVMAGDKFSLTVNSWWKSTSTPGTATNIVNSLVSALTAGIPGASAAKVTGTQLTASGLLPTLVNDFFSTQPLDGSKPKAYVNWVLFDEQFKFVGAGSGAEQVDVSSVYKTHTRTNLSVTMNGYLYVYVSNATPNIDVFFDNLQVTHIRGTLLEETHYYPFGLMMAGISSKAAGGLENKKKYNGIEFDNDLDINTYEAELRDLDPQLGKWWQIDPETEDQEMWSPYTSNYDNPILYQDPLGDEGEACCKGLVDALVDAGDKIMLSASGVLFGSLNTITGGLFPNDPFNITPNLNSEQKMYFNNGAMVGQLAPYVPVGPRSSPETFKPKPVEVPGQAKVEPVKTNSPEVPNKVQSSSNKQTGSYTNTHASEKTYSGKGSEARAKTSANRVAKDNNDSHKSTDWKPSKNTREAFKAEDKRIKENGGAGSSKNYNKINSPGKKYIEHDNK